MFHIEPSNIRIWFLVGNKTNLTYNFLARFLDKTVLLSVVNSQ